MKKEKGQQAEELEKLKSEVSKLKGEKKLYAVAMLDLMITVDNFFNKLETLKKSTLRKVKTEEYTAETRELKKYK